MHTWRMKQQHAFPACLSSEPCTAPPHISCCFLASATKTLPPLLPQGPHVLIKHLPSLLLPQTSGCFGGPPGGSGRLAVPPALKPGWAFTRTGERVRSLPLGNFPVASSLLTVLPPLNSLPQTPLIGSFGLPTSSVLLAFHSRAGC